MVSRYIFFVLIFFSLINCKSKNNQYERKSFENAQRSISTSLQSIPELPNDSTIKIRIPDKLDNTSALLMSELIDSIRYVALETNENSVIKYIEKVITYKDYIFVLDVFGNSLLQFDSRGKFIRRIGQKGKKPGEYSGLLNFNIDRWSDKLILLDDRANKFIYYTLNGQFIREQPIKYMCREFESINDSTYAVNVDGRPNLHLESILNSRLLYTDKKWHVLEKGFPYDANAEMALSTTRNCITRYGKKLIYNPNYTYDVYELSERGAKQKYFIDAGDRQLPKDFRKRLSGDNFNHKYNSTDCPYMYIDESVLETDNHLVTTLNHQSHYVYLYYCKKTGHLSCSPAIRNDRWYEYFVYLPTKTITDNNEFIALVDPEQVVNMRKEWKDSEIGNEIPKKIFQLINAVKESDNPILAIYKLKVF